MHREGHKAVFTAGNRCLSPQTSEASGAAAQELQLLVQSLTRKVGESEERYSLLQEQSESLKELLVTEKEEYTRKENMYKENVGFQRARRLRLNLDASVWGYPDLWSCSCGSLDPDVQRHHHSER